ncbi:hypothetical protein MILUP08_46581 [Micromonospora lupini str. Lupac 08]|uniref:Uncharacterized protein n=1 Tax=Micromonospora lupini str. Lupac 08 TaxID=1150864 RepID=I0LCY5_9ACTN|nr:hypothetical protein MILUP08_46581 [Micromonospora lupini str. Lupac 08]
MPGAAPETGGVPGAAPETGGVPGAAPETGEVGSDGPGSPGPEGVVGGGDWSVMNPPQHRLERFTIFPGGRPHRSTDPPADRGQSASEEVGKSLRR